MRIIINILKGLRNNYKALKYLIEQEKESKTNLGLRKKIWCIVNGFSSSKYELYNFRDKDYKLYLSDFKRKKTERINGPYSLLIDDKYIFSKTFGNSTATVYGRIKKGKLFLNNAEKNLTDLLTLLKEKKQIIVKKYRGGGGKGIYRLTFENEKVFIDDQLTKIKDFEMFIFNLSDHLIMEHLSQLEYSNNIYDGTINSIRVLTMLDPHTNEPFIPIAVHKFGSEKTKPVDNVWKGGMTALVDIESGVLGKPAFHEENNNKIEWLPYHPDTNAKIEGTVIPNWDKVKEVVLNIAKTHDYLKYVGWDIVLTDSGVKIIEGNNYSDVNILQIHKPLLKDERVRRFYKYHKII